MHTMSNSEDPDEMPHYGAFHQGLHRLLRQKQSSEKEIKIFYWKLYPVTPPFIQWTIPSLLHQPRRNSPLAHKGLKGLLSINTLIPLRISFIILILESLRVICFTWRTLNLLATKAFTGIMTIITPIPATMEGPRVTQRKYILMMIWTGPDQIILMYVIMSLNRWASTDMRLTISPTVDVFLAELDNFKTWNTKYKLYMPPDKSV